MTSQISLIPVVADVEGAVAVGMAQERQKCFEASQRASECEDCPPEAPQTASSSDSPDVGDVAISEQLEAVEAE